MRSKFGVVVVALLACGFVAAQGSAAQAGCAAFSGTADGFDKPTAVSRAQAAVADAIAEYKASKRLGAVSVSAMRRQPQPYWREGVSKELFYKPDIVTSKAYTICWSGVVSPYVCTSGAKACW